jgi:hypothetical protein
MTTKISGANISSIGNTGLNWQAVTVADGSTQVNATSGNGYLLDTNAGVIEVFLPTSPTRGDTIVLADYSGTFAQNRVIVNTGGVLIDSTVGSEVQITTNNTIAEFVYTDSAKGWLVKLNQAAGTTPSSALTGGNVYNTDEKYVTATGGTVTTSGDYKIHTFTGDGCFVVSCEGNPAGSTTVDYLVVGGGGGAGGFGAGGGGAGGFRYSASTYCSISCAPGHPLRSPTGLTMSVTTYPVTVGGGGGSGAYPGFLGATNGSPSVFSTITSTGGGRGGSECQPASPNLRGGQPGGSGGGASRDAQSGPGSGNTPPTSPSQGNNGGAAGRDVDPYTGAGGGGAIAVGTTNPPSPGSTPSPGGAGAGVPNAFGTSGENSGSYYYFSGGGGGGVAGPSGGGSNGGIGGGGDGKGGGSTTNGCTGTANTGGGGGGPGGSQPSSSTTGAGGAGGKGIVIIRYKFQ